MGGHGGVGALRPPLDAEQLVVGGGVGGEQPRVPGEEPGQQVCVCQHVAKKNIYLVAMQMLQINIHVINL